jgi:hypothetical protein
MDVSIKKHCIMYNHYTTKKTDILFTWEIIICKTSNINVELLFVALEMRQCFA